MASASPSLVLFISGLSHRKNGSGKASRFFSDGKLRRLSKSQGIRSPLLEARWQWGKPVRSSRSSLTEQEGTLLALVARAQPITAYQISKVYEESPVSNFSSSKGKIYPIIRRLRDAGLIRARSVKGDARNTEQLEMTKSGEKALRSWIKDIPQTHLLPEDPLRTKLQSFDLLTREERIQWISELKVRLLGKLDELEHYGEEVSVPYQDLVHENAVRSIRGRMDWLDLVLNRIVKEAG